MHRINGVNYKWIGKECLCPDKSLLNKNYKFFTGCIVGDITLEIGAAVLLIYGNRLSVGAIHYFYEIATEKKSEYNVAVELFLKPNFVLGKIDSPPDFHKTLEVVQQDPVKLLHVSVSTLRKRCLLVYGLEEENPEDLLAEFNSNGKDIVFICRYIATEKNNKYKLRGAVSNEIDVSDTETETSANTSQIFPEFSITNIQDTERQIKIQLKKQCSTLSNENKKSKAADEENPVLLSPSELISKLRISDGKFDSNPIVALEKLQDVQNLPKSPSKSNIVETPTSNRRSRRLQSVKENTFESPAKIIRSARRASRQSYVRFYQSPEFIPDLTNLNNIEEMDVAIENHETMTPRKTPRKQKLNLRIDLDEETKTYNPVSVQKTPKKTPKTAKTNIEVEYKLDKTPKKYPRTPKTRLFQNDSENETEKIKTPAKRSKSETKYVISENEDEIEDQIGKVKTSRTPRRSKTTKYVSEDESDFEDQIDKVKTSRTPRRSKTTKYNVSEDENDFEDQIVRIKTPKTPTRSKSTTKYAISEDEDDFEDQMTPKKQARKAYTPKSGRIKLRDLTPSIVERDTILDNIGTPMQKARIGLSLNAVPKRIFCREDEYRNIYDFVSSRICDQSSGCMYISGVPGTGKTMTVRRVMQDLSVNKDEEDMPDFLFLQLNALALTEPRQIYVEIVKNLINTTMYWEEALNEVEHFFKAKKKKKAHVILIDELDKLCNKKQDVIYNLLDLPFHTVTPLILITIANTMDLPERILTSKISSRLGLSRLTFKPYNHKDLIKIITERLSGDAVFKSEALELVARKVAAVSGDARRALAMCCRATEIAEMEDKDLVTMEIVDRVVNEMISSAKVQAIKCCSKMEKLILSAIANEVIRTGNEEVPFPNMYYNLEKMCYLESLQVPSIDLLLKLCSRLGGFRLLITQHGRAGFNTTLMLNISSDDIHFALQ